MSFYKEKDIEPRKRQSTKKLIQKLQTEIGTLGEKDAEDSVEENERI